MSEDPGVDRDRQHVTDDPETTAVRPALSDDLLDRPPSAEDDALADDEFMAPGGRRPSRLTRVLLALLILAVGVFVGVQVGKLTGGSTAGAAGAAGTGQARRFGAAGAGSTGAGGGTAGPRAGAGASAPTAEGAVSRLKAHTLVLTGQGAAQTVTFTDATTVTAPYGHRTLVVGDAVTVFGSRAADGSVNATSIVVR
jgi:hypothetical protein